MEKTITMDYEEYSKLQEMADLKDSKIKKMVAKKSNEIDKQLREIYKTQKELDFDRLRMNLVEDIRREISREVNSFGYVKYEYITDILFRAKYREYRRY